MWLGQGAHHLFDLARQRMCGEALALGDGEFVNSQHRGSPHCLMSALRAYASGESKKLANTSAPSFAFALKGIAKKCVLPIVPFVN